MATRLVIRTAAGALISRDESGAPNVGAAPVTLDLSGICNPQAGLRVEVQRMCDMGDWHPIGSAPLPTYDVDLDETLDA